MRALYCGSGWLPIVERIRERLPAGWAIDIWDRAIPLAEAVADARVILPSNAHVDAAAIAAASRLALIQQPAAGVEVVDLHAARARGIPVCNAPGANRIAVAEATIYMMLALARRIPRAAAVFERGGIGEPLGIELTGRRLGIVGLGRIGGEVATRARALGMEVQGIDSRATRTELLSLLADSHVVTLHCPLTEATRGLLDAEAFAAMRPGALLVNVARGPVIDRGALEQALDDHRLGGVAIDTYWHYPWDPADPLWRRPDVLATPHLAGSTEESFQRIATIVADNIGRIDRGQTPLHRVV